MSPEQAGMKEIDRRSDIFSLGIVLYEITTRYRLFKAPNEASTLQKILEAEILPPSKLVPGYPAALERIVLRTLSREPQGRYNTAEELQSDLETFIIQSGDPVLPGQVAELMRQTFELRITEKRELIQRCENMPHVTEESALDEDNSLTMGGATASVGAYKRRQKRRWLMIAAITLMVVGLGALGASIPDWLGGGDEFANLQRRRLVRVTIRATPASAEVRIDGRKVTNPYVKDRTSSEGESTVTVSADGYKTRRFDISLAEGGTFIVALSRKEKVRKVPRRPDAGVPDASVADMMPASVPDRGVPRRDMRVKKRRTRPKRHKRRPRPRRQKGLFDNPYG